MGGWKARVLALAAVLATALLVAACGGDDDKPSSPATAIPQSGAATNSPTAGPGGDLIDACTLVTKNEMLYAVGETAEGQVTNAPPTSTCSWNDPNNMTPKALLVLYLGSSAQATSDYYDSFTGDSVTGVGEKATWFKSAGILHVLQGIYEMDISVTATGNITAASQQNLATSLAKTALARLP